MTLKIDPVYVSVRKALGPGDVGPKEIYTGFLVDDQGNDLAAPDVGKPILLSDRKSPDWAFQTDVVYAVSVYITGATIEWEVQTEQGTKYLVSSERILH